MFGKKSHERYGWHSTINYVVKTIGIFFWFIKAFSIIFSSLHVRFLYELTSSFYQTRVDSSFFLPYYFCTFCVTSVFRQALLFYEGPGMAIKSFGGGAVGEVSVGGSSLAYSLLTNGVGHMRDVFPANRQQTETHIQAIHCLLINHPKQDTRSAWKEYGGFGFTVHL